MLMLMQMMETCDVAANQSQLAMTVLVLLTMLVLMMLMLMLMLMMLTRMMDKSRTMKSML
jgi:hypothetical protein